MLIMKLAIKLQKLAIQFKRHHMSALQFNYQLAFHRHFADIPDSHLIFIQLQSLAITGKKSGIGSPFRAGSSCSILDVRLAWCVLLQHLHFHATFSWLTSASTCQKGNGNYRQAIDSHGVASYQCGKCLQKVKKTPDPRTTKQPSAKLSKITLSFSSFASTQMKNRIRSGLI